MKNLLLTILFFAIFAINSFGQCNISLTTTNATCDYNCDGSAIATVTGTPPISIYWSAGSATSSTDSIFNVCPGNNYSCSIYDALGCSSTMSFSIFAPPPVTFLPDSIHDVNCFGTCNGDATVYPIGGTPPYTFNWGNGQTTQQAINLCANNYYVSVTDSIGCNYYQNISISEPSQIIDTTQTFYQPICSNNNGIISLVAFGGITGAGYNFVWSNGGNTSTISGLSSGIYNVTISDATGCSIIDTYILNTADGPTPNVSFTDITCFGANNGKVDTLVVNTPVNFVGWSTGLTATNTLPPYPQNLIAGNYTVTVSTPIGCNGYAMFEIKEPTQLIDNPSVMDNNFCFGDSMSQVYLMVNGGIPPYNFLWGPPLSGNQGSMAYNLHAGTYYVTITDVNGCTLSENFIVPEPPHLVANVIPVDISCFGNIDGMAIINMTGGTSPYYFSLDSLPNNWFSYDTLFSLTAGTYNLYIKDGNYCYLPHVTFSIIEPSVLNVSYAQTDPTCTDNDGSIHLTTTGGVQPYAFNWSSGAIDSVLVSLSQGNYNVTVTDAHGCVNEQYLYLSPSSFPAKLWGEISYSGGFVNPNDAEVFLFGQTTGMQQIDTISSIINTASTWEFHLIPGTYYLKTNILNPASYPNVLNTYYDSTFTWSLANAIPLNCDDTMYINFKMFESAFSNSGSGSLSGTISMYTAGKAVGEPVPGAEILVEQEPNDVPIKSVVTDTTGKYTVTGLGIGIGYHLLVDIPGLPLMSTYQNIAFTVTDTVHNNLNFLVDTITGTGIYADSVNYVPFVNNGINLIVYPNPFTSNINVSISLDNAEYVGFDLFDAIGRKIQSIENKEMLAGKHEIKITPNTKINSSCYLMVRIGDNVVVKKLISNQK